MADHIYIGSGKERTFDNGGSVVTISVDVDKLITACKDYGFTTEAGKRYIKLKIGVRREIDQYGNTHSVEVDTWKPDGARQGQGQGQRSAPASTYQKRSANASKGPSRLPEERGYPPDFPDETVPF